VYYIGRGRVICRAEGLLCLYRNVPYFGSVEVFPVRSPIDPMPSCQRRWPKRMRADSVKAECHFLHAPQGSLDGICMHQNERQREWDRLL